jgi:hypothetical protein
MPKYTSRGGPSSSVSFHGRLTFQGTGGAVRKTIVSAASLVIRKEGRTDS